MKPAAGGSHSSGLLLAILDLVIAWVVIVWVTRRIKRDMTAGDDTT